jgi:hypothetical protein
MKRCRQTANLACRPSVLPRALPPVQLVSNLPVDEVRSLPNLPVDRVRSSSNLLVDRVRL